MILNQRGNTCCVVGWTLAAGLLLAGPTVIAQELVRKPYLQMGAPHSVMIAWCLPFARGSRGVFLPFVAHSARLRVWRTNPA